MNVYGGRTFINGKQVRAVVACKRSELPDIIGGRAVAYARNYWSMTGNKTEINVAMTRPGVLFYTDVFIGDIKESDYHAVEVGAVARRSAKIRGVIKRVTR